MKGQKVHSIIDDIESEMFGLDRRQEKLDERENELREIARRNGLKSAKRLLKKIDPVFSGRGMDPQDVKVIFNPVEYVVFDGLNREKIRRIILLAYPPLNAQQEKLQKSISESITKRNISFKTLRVLPDGKIDAS
jgi:predicted Holliday junction resolvase-like endonuclease